MTMRNTKKELINMVNDVGVWLYELKKENEELKKENDELKKENEEMKWKIKSLECDKFGMHLDIKKRWEMEEKLTSSIKLFQKENEELKLDKNRLICYCRDCCDYQCALKDDCDCCKKCGCEGWREKSN